MHGQKMIKKTILVLISLIVFGCQNSKKKNIDQPNIIVILTDDQGWGDLSFNGNPNLSTPNIDKIGHEGISLNRFYVSPVCSPTRAELLTGRYHHKTGVSGTSKGEERLNVSELTIAEKLKEAGYKTGIFGKWHNGSQFPYHPLARGFDEFYGFSSGHLGNYFNPILELNGEFVKGNGYVTDDLTDHAIEFIKKNSDQPFFAYIPYNTPHSPMQVPDKYYNKFRNADLEWKNRNPELEDYQNTKAALAMCENIDWNVGKITSTISELGLEENTIIVFMSDNGPDSWRWNGGMKGKKASVDEGGVKVPCFIKWPKKIPKNKSNNNITGIIDLYPTLLSLANVNYENEGIDGINLQKLWENNYSTLKERKLFSHWRDNYSVRTERYFLDNSENLYDMIHDPGQTTNIRNSNQEIFNKLKSELDTWIDEVENQPQLLRPFPIGYSNEHPTYLPARDAEYGGQIQRSNRFPNSSFFTNWIATNDSIYWNVEVINEGIYDVEVFYTCKKNNEGSVVILSSQNNQLIFTIDKAHESSLIGQEYDRIPRKESYVKNFKKLNVGEITLLKGKQIISLRANKVANKEVMDFGGIILSLKK